jgi:hypothetical protein
VAVTLASEISPDGDQVGLVDAILRISTAAREVELLVGGQAVDRRRLGGRLPRARALRATAAGPQRISIVAEAEEPESGVTYAIQVSTDGRTWNTIGVGLRTPRVEWDRVGHRPGQPIHVRLIATNGLQRAVVLSDTLLPD